jgi:hypothetical protein
MYVCVCVCVYMYVCAHLKRLLGEREQQQARIQEGHRVHLRELQLCVCVCVCVYVCVFIYVKIFTKQT